MAISLVQSNGNTTFASAATATQAYSGSVTSGNLLVASAFCNDASNLGSFSDTLGNTWHTTVVGVGAYIGYSFGASSGADTITFHTNNGSFACATSNVGEFSGVGVASSVLTNTGAEPTNNPSSQNITVSGTSSLIVNAWRWSGGVPTNSGSFAAVFSYGGGGGFNGLAYQIAAAGTYQDTSGTLGGTNTWASLIVSFTPSGPGVYSVPDSRVAPFGPNASRTLNQTLIYDVQTSSNHSLPPVDSRVSGPPVDSRIAAIIPENSRTRGG